MKTNGTYVLERVGAVEVLGLNDFILVGRGEIDGDGNPANLNDDPDWQSTTSLTGPDGKPLDSAAVPFVALPPWMMQKVRAPVLGSKVTVVRMDTMWAIDGVVGDVAPATGWGEMSEAFASELRIPSSPTTGGNPAPIFLYRVYAGQPALVDGIQYALRRL